MIPETGPEGGYPPATTLERRSRSVTIPIGVPLFATTAAPVCRSVIALATAATASVGAAVTSGRLSSSRVRRRCSQVWRRASGISGELGAKPVGQSLLEQANGPECLAEGGSIDGVETGGVDLARGRTSFHRRAQLCIEARAEQRFQ